MTVEEGKIHQSNCLVQKNFRKYKDSAKDSGVIGHFGLDFTWRLW